MVSLSTKHLHSRDPVIPSQIRMSFARPEPIHVATIERFSITDVSDLVGPLYTSHGIASLYMPAVPVCGVATTVRCPPGDNLGLVKAISMAARGDVLVVDAQGFNSWCLGGFQLLRTAVEDRGLIGFVINGAYRDIEDARAAGLPLYGTGIAPWSGPKDGPFEINVPVCSGGVIVHPGDIVSASSEGIVVVPRAYAEMIAGRLEQALASGKSSADKEREARSVASFVEKVGRHVDEVFAQSGGVYLDP
jgi:regulator of RNase E activity RraA